ncbi:hypothetical protein L1049_023324 [Liquidambar formosana]|uniref:Kinesin-like protein n=1 Tax=Liquidambar formosana TaxID=63359 RepID=A0AAP0X0H2_LIQFO
MYPTAYTFDRVFRSDCSTRQVYEEGAKEVALSVVSGINSSVFAYGQTSSGKTYTMSGITEYTVADIYDYIERHEEREFFLKFSAMEIYNESVRDLLSTDSTPLRLLDDPERGTIVEKLTEETLRDWNHLKELLSICEAQRQIGETSLNETSSRSHQILRLTIESSTREFLGNNHSSTLTATVNFVDLAGSERASQSLSAGSRLKEGCHINRSLLTLGTVIRKLSKGRSGHVPFRDSKLTRILQSSLSGNAKNAIICTMSPARSHVEQSRNTLLFASCAKEVTTNAQINVVMSDKALVKHLQRELARLESELKHPGTTSVASDSAGVLSEKDRQIEELKKEIAVLILQRDLAQSQVEDLQRVVEDDRPSMAGLDQLYPKLRVRKSWEYEIPMADMSGLVDPHSVAVGSFGSQNSYKHSRSNSHEDYHQLPELEENYLHNDTSQLLSITTTDFVGSGSCKSWDEIEERNDENLDDLCKEVRCIEIEESSMNRYGESNTSFAEESTDFAALLVASNGDRADQESVSPPLKEDNKLSCIHPDFVLPSPEEPSPWLQAKDISSSRSLKLTKSSSCKASLMLSLSPPQFENIEKNENTPANVFEKDFTGRPEGLRKLSALNYAADGERLSRKSSHTLVGSAAVNELNVQTSTDEDITGISTLVADLKEMAKLQFEKQLADGPVQEIEPKANESAKNVRDVGLDPMQDDLESPSDWPSKFKELQKEIIELWHACNVSLVHRTYFFLLFKGDPTDSIYMEVELRRLSFLKDTFSQGNQTLQDGRTLTPASSMKALRQEREMLSKQMQKRFSEQDRESLYLKWGIGLNTKNRRLQLAHCLWTDTNDMDHTTESANIVAKLVGCIEPEQAYKEMFGLNFTPRCIRRKSFSWKHSMSSLF